MGMALKGRALIAAGCATASSRINAIAISQAKYNLIPGTLQQVVESYCAKPDFQPLAATVNQVGNP